MTFVLYIILFILLVFIWFFFDYRLGKKNHLQFAEKLESPVLYGSFDIFAHGKELFEDYFQSLKQAEESIEVVFYIVRNDSFSQEFVSILKKKAREGVTVRLLLDQIGSFRFSKKLIADLRAAGVQFQFGSRLKFPFLFYSSQVRNHRKITMIDGKIGYLGGFNVGKEYIDFDPKLSPWRDYHLKIRGEGVPFLQKVFHNDWQKDEARAVDNNELMSPHLPASAQNQSLRESAAAVSETMGQTVAHHLLATEANLLEENYLQLLRKAKESIIIGTPYFIPSKKIFAELLHAIERGVKLTVIVPAIADHILVQEASYRYFRILIPLGASVYQFKNGFYHAKTILIDEVFCEIGTANFDKRSFFLNKEINCYFHDRQLRNHLMGIIQRDIANSQLLSLEKLNKPDFFRTVKEKMAAAVESFL